MATDVLSEWLGARPFDRAATTKKQPTLFCVVLTERAFSTATWVEASMGFGVTREAAELDAVKQARPKPRPREAEA